MSSAHGDGYLVAPPTNLLRKIKHPAARRSRQKVPFFARPTVSGPWLCTGPWDRGTPDSIASAACHFYNHAPSHQSLAYRTPSAVNGTSGPRGLDEKTAKGRRILV